MKINSVVKVIDVNMDEKNIKGFVEKGCLAMVVDGKKEFPEFYHDLNILGPIANDFIFIKWIKEDPRWKGRIDGAYIKIRFEEVKINKGN